MHFIFKLGPRHGVNAICKIIFCFNIFYVFVRVLGMASVSDPYVLLSGIAIFFYLEI